MPSDQSIFPRRLSPRSSVCGPAFGLGDTSLSCDRQTLRPVCRFAFHYGTAASLIEDPFLQRVCWGEAKLQCRFSHVCSRGFSRGLAGLRVSETLTGFPGVTNTGRTVCLCAKRCWAGTGARSRSEGRSPLPPKLWPEFPAIHRSTLLSLIHSGHRLFVCDIMIWDFASFFWELCF